MKEAGLFILAWLNLLVGGIAIIAMLYSAQYPYHGRYTPFHVIAIILILLTSSATSTLLFFYPKVGQQ